MAYSSTVVSSRPKVIIEHKVKVVLGELIGIIGALLQVEVSEIVIWYLPPPALDILETMQAMW